RLRAPPVATGHHDAVAAAGEFAADARPEGAVAAQDGDRARFHRGCGDDEAASDQARKRGMVRAVPTITWRGSPVRPAPARTSPATNVSTPRPRVKIALAGSPSVATRMESE